MREAGEKVCGVLLAGGQSRRMGGGDKALRLLGDKPLLSHILDRAAPQVDTLILNANGDPARFAGYELPVVPDVIDGYAGPLAGVLTGMNWAAGHRPDCAWIATFACDAPFFPTDLVARLLAAVRDCGADMACAASEGRSHPVFGLWPVSRREELRRAMTGDGIRKVDVWTGRYVLETVSFEAVPTQAGPLDPFFNTNRPEDLATAAGYLSVAAG
jgi:molybdopterin-guanine dinucleotide biosynthesis protein A